MKTAHRQASHAKRRWQADPAALYRLMNRLQPFTPTEQLRLNLPPRVAYESLRTGRGEEADFHTLAGAVNVAMVRAETINPLAEQTAITARDALMRCWQRHQASGRWGFDGPALQDLPPALDLYEQLLALSTPQQMQDAMAETIRRMESGNHLAA